MNKYQWFFLGLISISMLCLSTLFIGIGYFMFGSDAIMLALMGFFFITSLINLREVIIWFLSKEQEERR